MSTLAFFDTNVLVDQDDTSSPAKQDRALSIFDRAKKQFGQSDIGDGVVRVDEQTLLVISSRFRKGSFRFLTLVLALERPRLIVVNLKRKKANSASNGLPFTVRKGKIYFVAVNGSNFRKGSFEAPWKSILQAKDHMSAGDVTYIRDGVAQTSEDDYGAYMSMDRSGGGNSGKPDAPKALVAYPGARVTIGKAHGLEFGIRTPNIQAREDWWVFSQLHIIGRQAIDMGGTGWKIVGNEIECPGGDGQVGCVETSQASRIKFYGNEVHNAGAGPAALCTSFP